MAACLMRIILGTVVMQTVHLRGKCHLFLLLHPFPNQILISLLYAVQCVSLLAIQKHVLFFQENRQFDYEAHRCSRPRIEFLYLILDDEQQHVILVKFRILRLLSQEQL